MTGREILGSLKRIKVFKGLSEKELRRVAGVVRVKTFREGVTMFEEGEKGRDLFLIHSGKVSIRKRTPDGGEQELAQLVPGAMFGEMALLEGERRSAGAVAVEDTVLLRVTKKDFEDLVNTRGTAAGKVLFGIARLLSARLRKMDEEFSRALPGAETEESIDEIRERLRKLRQDLFAMTGL